MKVIFALAASLLLSGCFSNPSVARKVLEDQGYTDVKTGSYDFGCSEGEPIATEFTAKTSNGNTVHGVVCETWLSGSTVRLKD